MKRTSEIPTRGDTRSTPYPRGFTLLEVALIVAIIGMMLMIIVGYLLAPKQQGPLPPVAAPTPIASSTPEPKAAATPVSPTPGAAASTPTHTIDLSPQGAPVFR